MKIGHSTMAVTSRPDRIAIATLQKKCDFKRIFLTKYQKMGPILSMLALLIILIVLLSSVHTELKVVEAQNSSKYVPVIVCYTDKDLRVAAIILNVWWLNPSRINCSSEDRIIQCDVQPKSKYKGKPDAYLFYGSFIESFPLPRDPKTLWGLIYEDTPKDVFEILHEKALNLFNFSATFSRNSDVPLTLIWLLPHLITSDKYYLNTSMKNSYLNEIAPVLYMQTDCETFTDRDEYVQELMKYISVDSYGLCLNNKKFPPELIHFWPDEKDYLAHLYADEIMEFIARYKFIVAIENSVCDDYVTEKLWRPLSVGSIPIYFGDPCIKDWLPNNKSAILLQDYPTPKLLSEHLYELLENDTKYEGYLEHKTKRLISNKRLLKEFEIRPYQNDLMLQLNKLYCIMCERLHENSSRVNIVTTKHLNCAMPTSALTLEFNPYNTFVKDIVASKKNLEQYLAM